MKFVPTQGLSRLFFSPDGKGNTFGEGGASDCRIHTISELNATPYPLDSAAGEEKYSTVMKNFRQSRLIDKGEMDDINAYYPRIKVLPDGRYFLIFHNNKFGGSVFYSFSSDLLTWEKPKILFQQRKSEIRGEPDEHLYMTPDACVLSDGSILAVTSYREGHHYRTDIDKNGVAAKISTDGGKTWSEEITVYVGTNWEPAAMEGKGEVFVFFSCTAPSIYKYGVENFDHRSSGIGMVRSFDGGRTWNPKVTGAPYLPQYVMRQFVCRDAEGFDRYNDQMAAPFFLNNGTAVLGAESYLCDIGRYKFSVMWDDGHFSEDVGPDKTGPENRKSNIFSLAGPYFSQFDSGEVILTLHWANTMRYRLGDCTAHDFYDEKILFPKAGMWGSVQKISSHSVVAVITTPEYEIQTALLYLNHRLNAKKMTPSLTANPSDWKGNTDALFCGSQSQAQVAVRVGYDDENVYLLAERADDFLTEKDALTFFLGGKDGGVYRLTLDGKGMESLELGKAVAGEEEVSFTPCDAEKAGARASLRTCGKESGVAGLIYEVAFPRALLDAEKGISLLFDLVNADSPDGEAEREEGKPGAVLSDRETWFTASFEG